MQNKENTFITEDSYNKIKSKSMEVEKKLIKAGFDKDEIDALNFNKQIFKSADVLHGSSYSHFSSFLFYDKNEDSKKGTETKSRIKVDETYKPGKDWYNIDKLQNWDKIPPKTLRAGVILIGPNAGAGEKDLKDLHFEPFENFQNLGSAIIKKYSNSFTSEIDFFVDIEKINLDNKLLKQVRLKRKEGHIRYDKMKTTKESNSDTKFFKENIEGSYVTDLIKGIPTYDSTELSTHLNKVANTLFKKDNDDKTKNKYKEKFKNMTAYKNDFRERLARVFVDILLEELELLGNITHTLVIMNKGKKSFTQKTLKLGNFEEKYKKKYGTPINIENVSHYVSFTPQHRWRYQLEEAYGRKEEDKSLERMEIWEDERNKETSFDGIEFIYKKL